jgi:chromosome segregation ATPase
MSEIEISLEEFEEFYRDRLNEKFSKKIKAAHKLLEDIKENMLDIKICMDHFRDVEGQLNDKASRSLNFFCDKISKEVDEINVPVDQISYENLNKLLKRLKQLFTNINDAAKKSLPKFQKEVQSEIKELNYLSRKLGKRQGILEQFILKKYDDVKDAEDILDKVPKFYTLRNNIENAKEDLENLQQEQKDTKQELEKLKKSLLKLEKHSLFQKLKENREELFQLKLKITNELGFKKALRKLKVELERENIHLTNINENYVKAFIKNPIRVLRKEGKDLTKFRGLLVQLRHVLEQNKLNLKSDKREKTIEQINKIFEDREIYKDLESYKNLRSNIKKIKKKIQKKDLDDQLEEVKNEISVYTQRLDHIESDVKRKNKDYLKYLARLKRDRNEFQKLVERIIGEPIKLIITFSF